MFRIVLVLFCLYPVFLVKAQFINLTISDAETHHPLDSVSVLALPGKKVLGLSDSTGSVTIPSGIQDTILIEKNGYHLLFLSLSHSNFDESHVLHFSLMPLSTLYKPDMSSLESFEYHFIHDTIPDSEMKVNIMEDKDVKMKREGLPHQEFRMHSWNLHGVKLDNHKQSRYNLKP